MRSEYACHIIQSPGQSPHKLIEIDYSLQQEQPKKKELKKKYLQKYLNLLNIKNTQQQAKKDKDCTVSSYDIENIIKASNQVEDAHKRLIKVTEDNIQQLYPQKVFEKKQLKDCDEMLFYSKRQIKVSNNCGKFILNNAIFNTFYEGVMEKKYHAKYDNIKAKQKEFSPENNSNNNIGNIIVNKGQVTNNNVGPIILPSFQPDDQLRLQSRMCYQSGQYFYKTSRNQNVFKANQSQAINNQQSNTFRSNNTSLLGAQSNRQSNYSFNQISQSYISSEHSSPRRQQLYQDVGHWEIQNLVANTPIVKQTSSNFKIDGNQQRSISTQKYRHRENAVPQQQYSQARKIWCQKNKSQLVNKNNELSNKASPQKNNQYNNNGGNQQVPYN